jgi:hypothetical protein
MFVSQTEARASRYSAIRTKIENVTGASGSRSVRLYTGSVREAAAGARIDHAEVSPSSRVVAREPHSVRPDVYSLNIRK